MSHAVSLPSPDARRSLADALARHERMRSICELAEERWQEAQLYGDEVERAYAALAKDACDRALTDLDAVVRGHVRELWPEAAQHASPADIAAMLAGLGGASCG